MLNDHHSFRRGLSLLELLIVIAIMATLIGLLLPACQKVRMTAARMRTVHQIKQFNIATANYCSQFDGRYPSVDGMGSPENKSVFSMLLRFLEQPNVEMGGDGPAFLRCPEDRSIQLYGQPDTFNGKLVLGNVSYAVNALLFRHPLRVQDISDGTSTTIAITQRYATCARSQSYWCLTHVHSYRFENGMFILNEVVKDGARRATFADAYFRDVVPITSSPSETMPSVPGLTFQVLPEPSKECDSRIPQAMYESGLIVGLADGSVRTLSRSISPATFWGMVTPQGGEVIPD